MRTSAAVGKAIISRRSARSAPAVIAARRSTPGTRAPSSRFWPRAPRSARGREQPRRRRRASPRSRPASAGVPVALELHRDHLPARREGFQQRPETEIDGQQAAVEQHEWPPAAVDLVVELQPVHRCVRHAGYDGTRPADSSRSADRREKVRAVTSIRTRTNGAPGARCVLPPGGHDSLAAGERERGRGLGDAASGVPATAQCR
jgi:hypothetical protein